MEYQSPRFALGADYESLETLKHACRTAAIKDAFEFTTLKSDKQRYFIKCKAQDCGWALHVTRVEDSTTFRIRKSIQLHDCFALNHTGHAQANSSFIASTIEEKLHQKPDYSPVDIVRDMRLEFGVEITYSKAFRARNRALDAINRIHEKAYQTLPEYCKGLIESNPGTVATLEIDEDRKFRRIFLCFGASADGFMHCRPILGLDGTHLKQKYQGILLP